MILAAERLFAAKGIAGVSLREINVAAGQKNTSATHYHFGTKAALIEAIFELRQKDVGACRNGLLDALPEGAPDVRLLAQCLVQPFVELLHDTERRDYVRFLAQLFVQPPENWRVFLASHDGAVPRLAGEVAKIMPLPAVLVRNRTVGMLQFAVTSLAAHARVSSKESVGPLPEDSVLNLEVFVVALVDAVTACWRQPPSEALLAAFDGHDAPFAADAIHGPPT